MIWTAIRSFFTGASSRLVEALAIAGAALGAYTAIYQSGKKSERADELIDRSKQEEKAHEIENANRAGLPDGAAAVKLREDWSR